MLLGMVKTAPGGHAQVSCFFYQTLKTRRPGSVSQAGQGYPAHLQGTYFLLKLGKGHEGRGHGGRSVLLFFHTHLKWLLALQENVESIKWRKLQLPL